MTPPLLNIPAAVAATTHYPEVSIEEMRAELLLEKDYGYYLMTFDSHKRFEAFRSIADEVTDELFWKLVRDVWTSSEVTMPHADEWLMLLRSSRSGAENLMVPSERRRLDRLPDTFTIYRGCGHPCGVRGLSWTLDYDRAAFFANYACGPRRYALSRQNHGCQPIIAKARCAKRHVFAYINARKEKEIIIDPTHVEFIGQVNHSSERRHA